MFCQFCVFQMTKVQQCSEVNFSVVRPRFVDDVLFTFTFGRISRWQVL